MYHRLKDLRSDRDLNQKDIADILNVTQATYSRYESGDLEIPIHALIELAKFYHVSVDYILGVDTDKSDT